MPSTVEKAERPRIVSVCRALPSPSEPASHTFVLQRIAAMARRAPLRALEPVPYFPLLKPKPGKERMANREVSGVPIQPVPMFYLPGILKNLDGFWLRRSISGFERGGAVDVLDAHFGYPEGVACVETARRVGIPSFVTVRGFEVDLMENPAMRKRLVTALNAATGVISVSHTLRETLVAGGVLADRITVIHNAVDRASFRPGSRAEARSQLGVAPSTRLIVSVGRLVSGKRHHVLIEAFQRLRQRHPDSLLCIIGAKSFEADYPATLARLADEAGGAAAVRLIGAVPQHEVVRWLHAADVFALATAREGCCNAVLEALAVGLPVVTTPAGDNSHFVTDDSSGYLVPFDDIAGFTGALERAFSCTWDSEQVSRRLKVGNWDSVAGRVLDYFVERIASRGELSRLKVQA